MLLYIKGNGDDPSGFRLVHLAEIETLKVKTFSGSDTYIPYKVDESLVPDFMQLAKTTMQCG